jgi:YbbR domain-containing protein
MITVRVEIEPEAAGTITLPASEISVTGVEDGLTGTVSTENLTIQVEGSQSAINSLTAESLQASVSAEGLSEGSHTVDISFSPPSGVYVTGEYEATLTLSEKASQTSTQSTSSTQTSVTRTSSAQTTAEQESDSGTEE